MNARFRVLHRNNDRRYAFHHEEIVNDWATPESGVKDFLYISLLDERTTERVTYRLSRYLGYNACNFPLIELMHTFIEQVGVGMNQLEFRYKGVLVPLDATPKSLGMLDQLGEEHVIAVSTFTSTHRQRVQCFTRLNRMGKVTVGIGPHQGEVFGSDLLPRILEYAGVGSWVNSSQVCRHWFHVSQRLSVLVQLQDGDSDSWQEDQRYPILLHDSCRHSFNLSLCNNVSTPSAGLSGGALDISNWNSTSMHKYKTDQAFGYCKAAGCRLVKSVYMESITRDLDTKWQTLDNAKTAFMNQMKNIFEGTQTADHEVVAQQQEFPPPGNEGNGFIAEARDWRYKNCAVELYRRYFSPDMYFIFPLIVNKQTALGLNFQSCTTSLIFGTPSFAGEQRRRRRRGDSELAQAISGALPSPIGSVSWRIHDAEEIAAKGMGLVPDSAGQIPYDSTTGSTLMMMHGSKPQIILEVLFISVWETERGGEYGSNLVSALESHAMNYAKSRGYRSALFDVEIGLEQPKAKQFWGNNGFAPVVCHNGAAKQDFLKTDVLIGKVVELEDWQLAFIDRRCLRFKDTEQYAKKVLVG